DVIERVAEPDSRRRLALARGRRRHRGDEDELSVRPVAQRLEVVERHLRLVVTVGDEVVLGDAEPLERDFGNPLQLRGLGDLDVGRHGVSWLRGCWSKVRCADCTRTLTAVNPPRQRRNCGSAARPAKLARSGSASSIRSASFHFAMRSERANEPTLSWSAPHPTARWTIATSSVSPDRAETIVAQPARRAASSAARAAETVPA